MPSNNIRRRTVVPATSFKALNQSTATSGIVVTVRVGFAARLRAAIAIFTGNFAFVGHTAFVDIREQVKKQHETIGLVAALLFTVSADWTLNTLELVDTTPAWVGPLYVLNLWTGCFCLVMCM